MEAIPTALSHLAGVCASPVPAYLKKGSRGNHADYFGGCAIS
jgi:hypothetical protein